MSTRKIPEQGNVQSCAYQDPDAGPTLHQQISTPEPEPSCYRRPQIKPSLDREH